ncbi:MAG: PaaI family thioesterase [Deltaproteobacteria bacterium]|nr:PaaI family thioesterase [Deltaproteobacteria bacterium]
MGKESAEKYRRLRPEINLERMHRRNKGYLPEMIGIEWLSIEPGKVTGRVKIRQDLLAPNGYLHAASIIGLADTACGYGTFAHLPDGAENFTTLELKANFLGTLREGAMACEALLIHAGRTVQVWDAVVTDEGSGRTLALFRCTQMILWPKS